MDNRKNHEATTSFGEVKRTAGYTAQPVPDIEKVMMRRFLSDTDHIYRYDSNGFILASKKVIGMAAPGSWDRAEKGAP